MALFPLTALSRQLLVPIVSPEFTPVELPPHRKIADPIVPAPWITPTSFGSGLSPILEGFKTVVLAVLIGRLDEDAPISGTFRSSGLFPVDWGSLASSSIHSSRGGGGGLVLVVRFPLSDMFSPFD